MAAIANFPLADAFAARTVGAMAVDVAIDTELLKREIKKTYAAVSQEPSTDFIFSTGRAWAEEDRFAATRALLRREPPRVWG